MTVKKENDYRRKFKEHYGIDFSNDYVVHHIDFDRSNNDIDNLLLLPKKLHAKYHHAVNVLRHNNASHKFDVDVRIPVPRHDYVHQGVMKSLCDALIECQKWADYKMYLDGDWPNIHHLKLE